MTNLVPPEKYKLFKQTELHRHYLGALLVDQVNGVIEKRNITKENYKKFNEYEESLRKVAQDFHKAHNTYLGHKFQQDLSAVVGNSKNFDIILRQIAKAEKKDISEIRKMSMSTKMKKTTSLIIKEMCLAIIETKLMPDQS